MQSTIAIFPLPNLILFQGAFLSLHIFEPRYRMMIAYTLECDGELGITSINKNSEIESIFGWGKIIKHDALPDGRSNIILEGYGIAKIQNFQSTDPFIIADVEKIPNSYSYLKTEEFQNILDELLSIIRIYLEKIGMQEAYFQEIARLKTIPFPLELICSFINCEYSLKQDIFLTFDPMLKAKKLLNLLYKL
jgi:ATP-dependent Lon protease